MNAGRHEFLHWCLSWFLGGVVLAWLVVVWLIVVWLLMSSYPSA